MAAGGATGILGSLRILVDADTSRAQATLRKLGGTAGVIGGVIGTGLGFAGVAALRMGDDYKKATDAIRIGTGDTGKVLAGIEQEFKAVAGRVPQNLAVVGQAMADVRTRTGLLGDDLGRLTESFLDVSDLLGVDVSTAIAKVTRMYGDWSVAQQDQLATNDLLLRASQASGIAFDRLADQMVQFGAPLRNIGFTMEDAVAMLSKWEKEGVNTELALGGLKIALGEFAKEGINAKEGLDDLIARIQETDDVAQAMAMGVGRFGSRAGPDMVAAIREGRFEFDEFRDTLVAGDETIQGLSDESRDFGDAIREMGNRVKTAVGPITDSFAGIADAMGNAIFLLPALTGAIGNSLGRMAGSARVRGAAAKAGALMGRAMALGMVGSQAIGSMVSKFGSLAGGRFGAAFKVAAIAAVALLWIEVWNQFNAFQAKVASAQAHLQDQVNQQASKGGAEALANLKQLTSYLDEVQGWNRILGDTFGGKEQLEGLRESGKAIVADMSLTSDQVTDAIEAFGAAADQALSRGNQDIAAELTAMADMLRTRGQEVAQAAQATPPDIAGPIRQEFKVASAAVAQGFGAIKAALQNPPQMISRGDRLANMATRMKKIMANIRKSVKAEDPVSLAYWEKARAKQAAQADRLKAKNVSTARDVKTAYRNAGVEVKGTWADVKTKTVAKTEQLRSETVAKIDAIATHIGSIQLYSSGVAMMDNLALGIRAGIANVAAAANEAAAAMAAPLVAASPPKTGPLHTIDKSGGRLMDAWLKPIEKQTGRVAGLGSRLGAALAPQPVMGALALARGGGGMGGGTIVQVGTLIASESGLDELEHRMARRKRRTSRQRRFYNDSD